MPAGSKQSPTQAEKEKAEAIAAKAKQDLDRPPGYRSKNLDKLVRFVNSPTFVDELEPVARSELEGICKAIRIIGEGLRAPAVQPSAAANAAASEI